MRRAAPVFLVEAKGRYTYREEVSARIFSAIQVGDELRVSLSPVFTEWKTVEVVGLSAFLPERVLLPSACSPATRGWRFW
jgi:hypothetical protein